MKNEGINISLVSAPLITVNNEKMKIGIKARDNTNILFLNLKKATIKAIMPK